MNEFAEVSAQEALGMSVSSSQAEGLFEISELSKEGVTWAERLPARYLDNVKYVEKERSDHWLLSPWVLLMMEVDTAQKAGSISQADSEILENFLKKQCCIAIHLQNAIRFIEKEYTVEEAITHLGDLLAASRSHANDGQREAAIYALPIVIENMNSEVQERLTADARRVLRLYLEDDSSLSGFERARGALFDYNLISAGSRSTLLEELDAELEKRRAPDYAIIEEITRGINFAKPEMRRQIVKDLERRKDDFFDIRVLDAEIRLIFEGLSRMYNNALLKINEATNNLFSDSSPLDFLTAKQLVMAYSGILGQEKNDLLDKIYARESVERSTGE